MDRKSTEKFSNFDHKKNHQKHFLNTMQYITWPTILKITRANVWDFHASWIFSRKYGQIKTVFLCIYENIQTVLVWNMHLFRAPNPNHLTNLFLKKISVTHLTYSQRVSVFLESVGGFQLVSGHQVQSIQFVNVSDIEVMLPDFLVELLQQLWKFHSTSKIQLLIQFQWKQFCLLWEMEDEHIKASKVSH